MAGIGGKNRESSQILGTLYQLRASVTQIAVYNSWIAQMRPFLYIVNPAMVLVLERVLSLCSLPCFVYPNSLFDDAS